MKTFTIAIAMVGLTACSTANKPNIAIGPNGPVSPNKRALLGQNVPAGPNLSYAGVKNPHKLFETLYQQSYCQQIPSVTLNDDSSVKKNCYVYKDTISANKKAEAMLYSGFAYSELLCDRYFNVLANSNQDLGFSMQALGLASGFTSAVLGLTGSPSKSIALVAAGFSTTIAGMESYQQNYHFGPDVSAVRKLIMDGQRDYQNTITGPNLSNLTHYQAISHLKRHQAICQVDTIKSWVTAAVEKQKIKFNTTARDDFYSSTALLEFRKAVGKTLNLPGPLPSDQVVNLVWLTEVSTTKSVREKYLFPALGAELSEKLLKSDGEIKTGYRYQTNIVTAFSQLPSEAKIRQRQAAESRNEKANTELEKPPEEQEEPKEFIQKATFDTENIVNPLITSTTATLENRGK